MKKAYSAIICFIALAFCAGPLYAQESAGVTPTPFTFIIYGDTRKAHPLEGTKLDNINHLRPVIANKIAELGPAFIVNTGDLVMEGSDKGDWKEFDALIKPITDRKIPYYPVLGNHEYKEDDEKDEAMQNYFQRFPQINNRKWYAFTSTNCAFIMLDSNFSQLSKDENTQQDKWLAETINLYQAITDVSFIFVFFHHPPYTNSTVHDPDKGVQERFVPALEKASKVKFVFNGHCHNYERFKMGQINYIVTGGGGAPVASLLKPKEWRYPDEYDISGARPRGPHICIVTTGADSIAIKTLHLNTDSNTWVAGDIIKEFSKPLSPDK
jgi:3',5'-cyclic AMP phosphodiesterase CpdA